MVGKICENKGQIRLLEALEGTGLSAVFIGPPDPAELDYFKNFLQKTTNIQSGVYLGYIPFNSPMLPSAYAAAKVVVMPSLSETFGNICLEGGATGAHVVVSRHLPISEYLENKIIYCNPKCKTSIREAIIEAFNAPPNDGLREYVLNNFTWDVIAAKYLEKCEKLLKK